MLTVTLAVAEFPALSTAVSIMTCPAPSVVMVTGEGQDAIPDTLSLQVNVTVTFVLFHPLALGLGDIDAVMVGGVVSMLMLS